MPACAPPTGRPPVLTTMLPPCQLSGQKMPLALARLHRSSLGLGGFGPTAKTLNPALLTGARRYSSVRAETPPPLTVPPPPPPSCQPAAMHGSSDNWVYLYRCQPFSLHCPNSDRRRLDLHSIKRGRGGPIKRRRPPVPGKTCKTPRQSHRSPIPIFRLRCLQREI